MVFGFFYCWLLLSVVYSGSAQLSLLSIIQKERSLWKIRWISTQTKKYFLLVWKLMTTIKGSFWCFNYCLKQRIQRPLFSSKEIQGWKKRLGRSVDERALAIEHGRDRNAVWNCLADGFCCLGENSKRESMLRTCWTKRLDWQWFSKDSCDLL